VIEERTGVAQPSTGARQTRVIVLAGPSGAGKSHLADRLGLPVLRLDDFYKDGDDPTLPRLDLAGGDPIVDWDDPASWRADRAVATIEELCRTGRADVPTYDISSSSHTGHRVLDLGGSPWFVAEGIFAHEIVGECRARGLLGEAFCVTQPPLLTFARRLVRDLREHRKPPFVLVRRGLHLLRLHRPLVREMESLGCRAISPEEAYRRIGVLTGVTA
jgi:uridine kinase